MTQLAFTAPSETQSPVTGRQVLYWLLGAFGVISAVNLALVVFALATFTGETQAKSYVNGLDFNRTLEQVAAQRERGWTASNSLNTIGGRQVEIKGLYLDRQNTPLHGLQIEAQFIRPTNEGHDFTVAFTEDGNGAYRAVGTVPLPGQWQVRVVARETNQPDYVLDYRVTVK